VRLLQKVFSYWGFAPGPAAPLGDFRPQTSDFAPHSKPAAIAEILKGKPQLSGTSPQCGINHYAGRTLPPGGPRPTANFSPRCFGV